DRIWFVAHADGEGLQPEGTELSPEGASGNHPRDVAAHPDSDGDTPPAAGGTLETSGARVDARDGGRGEEPQRPDGLPGLPRAAPDTDCKGLEGRADLGKFPKEGEEPASGQPSRFLCPGWEEFPTQSPVCGRDDGVPRQLDGITFSSWRQQSVKGYGNAIVPQVIHEIFKAIESTYK
ncbi:DNA cytosine methyltransferase, partial [Bacteroides eggerthii]|nr:DNA cytosine methyltransferase [Bacteroides eggerthii]